MRCVMRLDLLSQLRVFGTGYEELRMPDCRMIPLIQRPGKNEVKPQKNLPILPSFQGTILPKSSPNIIRHFTGCFITQMSVT